MTLSLSGDQPSGPVLFQLPAFVGNIAHASTGTVDEAGTVTVAPSVRSVTVDAVALTWLSGLWIVTPLMRGVTIRDHG